MPRRPSRNPTELELEILKVLWRHGPCTGRQIRDALAQQRNLAYTSVMTILAIMTRKGTVRRRKRHAGFCYAAAVTETSAAKGILRDLLDRVFGGSTSTVMQHLLETADLDAAELKAIRQLIDKKAKESSS